MKRPKDVLKWVAAGFALVATASAEYELARAIGMHPVIAAAVPGALDAYAVRALRAHREVFTAVLAMVGVNAASHLVTAGVLHVGWPLITAVSAIAPLVLWRVHALSAPGEHRRRVLWGVPKPLADVPPVPVEPEPACASCGHARHRGVCTDTVTCDWCGWDECPALVLDRHQAHACVKRWEHTSTVPPVPDHVPDEWNTVIDLGVVVPPDEHANVLPFRTRTEHADTADTHMADEHANVLPFRSPTGHADTADTGVSDEHANVLPFRTRTEHADTPGTVVSDAVRERDRAALLVLRTHMADEHLSDVPGVRDIKKICKVSTDRAQRVRSLAKGETQ